MQVAATKVLDHRTVDLIGKARIAGVFEHDDNSFTARGQNVSDEVAPVQRCREQTHDSMFRCIVILVVLNPGGSMNAVKRIKDGKVQFRQRFFGGLSRLDKATVPVGPYTGFFNLHLVEGIG